MKLGSLFDGIGTFPLSASQYGIKPVWASEIEPWPIKVTHKHFPNMKHLGDITQVNGAEIEPVDIITFGSPCQDLSVAGKREGLSGERSGLFSHAVRIIREMRAASSNNYPRFAVWENVPGAYSSNKGQDFRAVLEEIAEAEIPIPTSGKWAEAGMVRTERTDIAWRTLDAQYWGVPQRRKRIFLVADFRGQCAGEILFVEQGLSGDSQESGSEGQEAAGNVGAGVKDPVYGLDLSKKIEGIGMQKEIAPTLTIGTHAGHCNHVLSSYWDGGQISDCLDCSMLAKGQMMPEKRRFPAVLEPQLYDMTHADEVMRPVEKGLSPTLNSRMGTGGNQVPVMLATFQNTGQSWWNESNIGATIRTPCGEDSVKANLVATVDCRNLYENDELSATIQAKPNGGQSLNYINPVRQGYAVRRLTPTEALRLQGFPDWWLDIEGASDTAKYKAIGNSIAKPCSDFVIGRIAEVLRRDA